MGCFPVCRDAIDIVRRGFPRANQLKVRSRPTTWRASLATRGVVDRFLHWGLRDGREIWATHRESLGTILEAIPDCKDHQENS